ncbi:MAG: hypothetical protein WDA26_08520 [Pusillimonas sp.]
MPRKRRKGRPALKISKRIENKARKAARYGASNAELAQLFGISMPSFYRWKAKFPGFNTAILEGRRQRLLDRYKAVTGEELRPFVELPPPIPGYSCEISSKTGQNGELSVTVAHSICYNEGRRPAAYDELMKSIDFDIL